MGPGWCTFLTGNHNWLDNLNRICGAFYVHVVDLHSGSIVKLADKITRLAYLFFPMVTCKKIPIWNSVAFHLHT